jgi:L-cysteine S-thiosulfotransferase
MKTKLKLALSALVALSGCAVFGGSDPYQQEFEAMTKAAFRDQGIAKLDRLQQDPANVACSKLGPGEDLDEKTSKALEAQAAKTVVKPADGNYIGNWQAGERLAQNGRGMTWSDVSAATTSNGGNCYNCHQITKQEVSFGTIGPSLNNYGKLRGVSSVTDPNAKAIIDYTWAKLWNAKAFNACSGMPRFGHAGLLSEQQLKDIMALLLDPKSPVNQ